MVAIETCEGPLQVPDALVRAATVRAERQAELVAAYLDSTELFRSRSPSLPAAFLLELAAVLELGTWERQDLCRHLDVDLPSHSDAAESLASRAAQRPGEFEGPDAAPLSRKMFQVWATSFAWNSHQFLHADVILGEVDEDAFVDLLANFLWQHQSELANLISPDGDDA